MRIIAGSQKGRRLYAPEGDQTRPTSDRTREALFSILGSRVPDARVLDLFAGSGALALEALSRGARCAVLCDHSRRAREAILRNIEATGLKARCRLWAGDWRGAVAREEEPFDLVFLDPPYRMTRVYAQALEALRARRLLAPDALAVLEREAARAIELPEGFVVRDERIYRDTAIAFVAQEGAIP